jgi:hypothetical protein
MACGFRARGLSRGPANLLVCCTGGLRQPKPAVIEAVNELEPMFRSAKLPSSHHRAEGNFTLVKFVSNRSQLHRPPSKSISANQSIRMVFCIL